MPPGHPSLRPQFRASTRALGNGNLRIVCDDDGQGKRNPAEAKRAFLRPKRNHCAYGHSRRRHRRPGNRQHRHLPIESAVSFAGTFTFTSNADAGQRVANLTANDVNTAVAAKQASFDENIVIGELYKIGSALCVCTARTGALLESAADNGNQSIDATFECVREGQMSLPPGVGGTSNATLTSQIFRLSRGAFVTEYPTQALELGIRSTVGIRVAGLTNTIEAGYTYDNIDAQACPAPRRVPGPFPEIGAEDTLAVQQYNAGAVQTTEDRYSYFKILFRSAGTDDAHTELEDLYGIRSETSTQVYNYIRFDMPEARRYEFLLEPVSGYESEPALRQAASSSSTIAATLRLQSMTQAV